MLPIMPPHFMNNSRNGHIATTSGSNDKDNFFKIENILNRNALNSSRIINKNKSQQQQQLIQLQQQQQQQQHQNIGVYCIGKIKIDSITCNFSSDELIKNCNNRKINVKISECDGYLKSNICSSDYNWIKIIQIAKDVHSSNCVIEIIENKQIRLRITKDIEENDELLLWFSEEISYMMNIPFLTPMNIRGNNCYTCHECKTSFEYPNPLKIHIATSCSHEPIDMLWNRFLYAMKKNYSNQFSTTTIKPQIPSFTESSQDSINSSLASSLFFSAHNHLVMKTQSGLYQFDRQSAFNLVTPSPQQSQRTQRLPSSVPLGNHNNSSHSLFSHQHFPCNYQNSPIAHRSSTMHNALFTSSSSSLSPSVFSASSTNTLLTTTLSSASHSPHQHISSGPGTSVSAAAAAAAAALNAAAQIETIVSNMGASKQGHLCIYCGKLYSRKYGLKIHIRTHTGFKPLKCKYCFRPFGDPSNLNKHVRLHMQSGNLSFRCHLCNKTLARRRDLQRHIETRHCVNDGDNISNATPS